MVLPLKAIACRIERVLVGCVDLAVTENDVSLGSLCGGRPKTGDHHGETSPRQPLAISPLLLIFPPTFYLRPKQDVLRLVDARGKVGRSALVRVKLHHQLAMRGANFIFVRPFGKPQHLIGLLPRHAPAPARRLPSLGPGGIFGPLAPALRRPVDIGLDQDCALLVGTAQLLKQNEQVLVAQRGEGPARELALEDSSLHMAAVVIERHFECVGAHLRLLARRLVGGTERSPCPEPRPRLHAEQREAEKGERDGERERTTGDEEEGEEQERHAGALPQNQGKRLRIGRCEQTRAKDEDEKSRKTGKKRWHWTRI